jgi:MarR family transcriptional regulator, transcriptional regulator for hemolysin
MPAPRPAPIGLQLAATTKTVSRAFDDALGAAGGSLPTWLVLLSVKTGHSGNQRQLADLVGVGEATLTHHLNNLAERGLVTRERDPSNRRVHQVGLTAEGEAVFLSLRSAAHEFDRRLRNGLSDGEIASLRRLLETLTRNASGESG